MSKQTDLINIPDAITVDGSNNVGIGTSSPDNNTNFTALTVKSTSGSGGGQVYVESSGAKGVFGADNVGSGAKVILYTINADDPLVFGTSNTERMRIDSSGKVGIGTSSPSTQLEVKGSTYSLIRVNGSNTNNAGIDFGDTDDNDIGRIRYDNSSDAMQFWTNNAERMRLDSSGNLFVARTAEGDSNVGHTFRADGFSQTTRSGGLVADFNRINSDGDIVRFQKDGASVGTIGNKTRLYMAGTDMGIYFGPTYIAPVNSLGNLRDNQYEIGNPSYRWEDAYITNGVTTGSDANDKQDIATLTDTEMLVAARLSQTFRTYRWKDKVVEKGDNARTHTGTIAQEVQAAFTAEGLDAGDYAMFMSNTWWEHDVDVPAVEAVAEVTDEDGNVTTEAVEAVDAYTRTDNYDTEAEAPEGATSKTRMGIRYPELLSFVAAYNEQRFASIEARLTALEA